MYRLRSRGCKVVRVLRVQGKVRMKRRSSEPTQPFERDEYSPIARSRNAALGAQGVQYGRKPVCDGY